MKQSIFRLKKRVLVAIAIMALSVLLLQAWMFYALDKAEIGVLLVAGILIFFCQLLLSSAQWKNIPRGLYWLFTENQQKILVSNTLLDDYIDIQAKTHEDAIYHATLEKANLALQQVNRELEEAQQHERELRIIAELAEKESLLHKTEFQISYQELKATEKELRHYTEELESLNEKLADANIRGAELQVELEDGLEREKAQKEELLIANKSIKEAQVKLIYAEKMASLGQLVEGVADELNNPMNFVSGGIQGIKVMMESIIDVLDVCRNITQKKDNNTKLLAELEVVYTDLDWEETKGYFFQIVQNIENGINRVLAIAQSLHHFAQTRSNTSLSPQNLAKSIDSIWKMIGTKRTGEVTLERDYEEVSSVICSARDIHQVLMHLFNNALDAVNEHGTIRVKIWQQDSRVFLAVSDNGHGVPKHIVTKIFDPFFTTKPIGQGIGLGLNISQNIMKEHDGHICLKQENGWTSFVIDMPIYGAENFRKVDFMNVIVNP